MKSFITKKLIKKVLIRLGVWVIYISTPIIYSLYFTEPIQCSSSDAWMSIVNKGAT